ncbi:MAG: IMPACT family protein [Oscillospiraceae bacterium]|jgi:uncharacterized YigZ family protein|nr:IMPACT family protein [Oscillospiraceae bacterium]
MDKEFLAPTRDGTSEITEKRSRFIGRVFPVASEQDAKNAVERVKAEHRDARHNAWCYIAPDGKERASDDGEPSGTAGTPMLEMLRHEGIRGAAVVVTRYFGGVLLGPGGLARAYTAAAKNALEASEVRRFTTKTRVKTVCAYASAPIIKREIAQNGGAEDGSDYAEDVTLYALFGAEGASAFAVKIKELTAGTVTPEIIGEKIVPVEI